MVPYVGTFAGFTLILTPPFRGKAWSGTLCVGAFAGFALIRRLRRHLPHPGEGFLRQFILIWFSVDFTV